MKKNQFFLVIDHYLRRALRDPFGLFIFTVLPVLIIYILSLIITDQATEDIYVGGYNMVTTYLSVGMMLLFQLNSGSYVLSYLNADFGKSMKWRLRSTPCPTHLFAFACTLACALFSAAQGVLIVTFTSIFMDVYWGNLAITLLVILLSTFCSQFLNIILFFYVRSSSVAEGLAWFWAWSMAALGGLMFELPDTAFFAFMEKYGTPFSLGQTAIQSAGFLNPSASNLWISLACLFCITLLFGTLVVVLGRRKLA